MKSGKFAKERLSIMLCCSATGKKLKPLIIGNDARPCAFKQNNVYNVFQHCWETLYMNILYKQGLLISEQQVTDNPLFDLATVPRDLQATSPDSSSQLGAPETHTTG